MLGGVSVWERTVEGHGVAAELIEFSDTNDLHKNKRSIQFLGTFSWSKNFVSSFSNFHTFQLKIRQILRFF